MAVEPVPCKKIRLLMVQVLFTEDGVLFTTGVEAVHPFVSRLDK
jgi:hypothetical protein